MIPFPIDNNGTVWWFVWTHGTNEKMFQDLKRTMAHPNCKQVIIASFEEYEAVYIFDSAKTWKKFSKYAASVDVKVHLISPAYKGSLNNRYYINDKRQTPLMHFFANICISRLIQHKLPLTTHETINKLFVSTNGKGHPHRCMFIDTMYKSKLQDYGHVSWNAFEVSKDYKFEHFPNPTKKRMLDWKTTFGGDIFVPPPHYKSSLLSIVCESNLECIFTTEKTYTPIIHKRPFIIFAVPNFHTALRELGFQLFDEIFDYSFDTIENDQERCEAMFQQVAKHKDSDYNKLLEKCKPAIEHNFNLICSKYLKTPSVFDDELLHLLSTTQNSHWHENYKENVFTEKEHFNNWLKDNNLTFEEIL